MVKVIVLIPVSWRYFGDKSWTLSWIMNGSIGSGEASRDFDRSDLYRGKSCASTPPDGKMSAGMG
jgi:hypothetical protein